MAKVRELEKAVTARRKLAARLAKTQEKVRRGKKGASKVAESQRGDLVCFDLKNGPG